MASPDDQQLCEQLHWPPATFEHAVRYETDDRNFAKKDHYKQFYCPRAMVGGHKLLDGKTCTRYTDYMHNM
jgi:hypothetical protein